MKKIVLFLLAITVLLGAYFLFSRKETPVIDDSLAIYSNSQYGFSLKHPKDFLVSPNFESSYILTKSWSITAPEGTGDPVVAIKIPSSNEVLSAEVRIGESNNSLQIKACTKGPEYDTRATTSTVNLNGTTFSTFSTSDAALSHFAKLTSLRVVRNNTCFAIEEVIYGTNPEVYDPPRSLPFTEEYAQSELDKIVKTFVFSH